MIKADSDYYANPTLERLCAWEQLTVESNRLRGYTPSGPSSTKGRNMTMKPRKDPSTTTVDANTANTHILLLQYT